jgi:outer membrane lipoprotein SlyB
MKKVFGLCVAALTLAACQADIDSNHYNSSSTGKASAASACTVVTVRQVNVSSNNNQVGTLVGGAAGGVAGYSIGSGNTAHLLGGIGGAVLGGIAGNATQSALSSQSGYEYVVKLDNGQLMTLTQGDDTLLTAGQRCMILFGNPSRVIAY